MNLTANYNESRETWVTGARSILINCNFFMIRKVFCERLGKKFFGHAGSSLLTKSAPRSHNFLIGSRRKFFKAIKDEEGEPNVFEVELQRLCQFSSLFAIQQQQNFVICLRDVNRISLRTILALSCDFVYWKQENRFRKLFRCFHFLCSAVLRSCSE